MSKERNQYWQIIRGVCMLAVVMIHCPSAADYSTDSLTFAAWLTIRQIINFPVACFIFMSGYFTDVEECQTSPTGYIRTRMKRLLVPFFLWSFFYSGVSVAGSILEQETINWTDIILRIFVGKSATPFYYILVLLQLTLLTPLMINIIEKNGVLNKLMSIVTPAYLVYVYVFNIAEGGFPPYYATVFMAWFVFYFMGLCFRMNRESAERISHKFGKLRYVFAALFLSIAEAFIITHFGLGAAFGCSQLKFTGFLYSMWLYHKRNVRVDCDASITHVVKYIGDVSYGIFYLHCFVISILNMIMNLVIENAVWGLRFIVIFVLSVVINVVIICCVKRVASALKLERLLYWFGF